MKIGSFAKANHTSIDTIRHYMDLSLIVPEKIGGQYDFDAVCQYDYDEIMYLKGIGFALLEIQKLMLFRRIGKLTDYDKRIAYKKYFDDKLIHIETEKSRLTMMYSALQKEISRFSSETVQEVITMGVPLSSLDALACINCGNAYELTEGTIYNKEITNGKLKCSCGHVLEIYDGIVLGDAHLNKPETMSTTEAFVDEYITTTSLEYLQKLNQSLDWTKRHVDFDVVKGGIALELGSGHGFFMRHFIDAFPDDCLFIAVDYNLEVMRWLKAIVERNRPKCKILYLCADFAALPLKPQSIDLLLDISGSSNYAFEHTTFLLDKIDVFTKPTTTLHGYYILFENFAKHSKIQEAYRRQFKINEIESQLTALGYNRIDSMITASVEEGGPREDYFVKNEKVYSLIYHGQRT